MNEEQSQQSVQQPTSKKKPIIIALVIAVLLAVAGYVVYASQQSKINDLNKQIETLKKQSEDTSKESASTTETTTTQPTVSYLTVKEWGIKVPQTPKGNTLSYEINGEIANFVSSEQKAIGGTCGTFNFARYHVTRKASSYKPQESTQEGHQLLNADKVTVGNYTYYITTDMTGGVCDDNQKVGESISQAEQTANTDLFNALKGLVAN